MGENKGCNGSGKGREEADKETEGAKEKKASRECSSQGWSGRRRRICCAGRICVVASWGLARLADDWRHGRSGMERKEGESNSFMQNTHLFAIHKH